MPDLVSRGGLAMRPHFVSQMSRIADRQGLLLEWSSDYWVCTLLDPTGRRRQRIVGGYFPLNDAAASQLANDKVATYAILSGCDIPAVPHLLLRPQGRDALACADEVQIILGLPVVLKPNLESGGVDVYRALDEISLTRGLENLVSRYRSLSISPYLVVEDELRFVVLDGVVRMVVEKLRGPSEWRHNLRLGALARLVDPRAHSVLSDLAVAAASVMGLRFATVDIVTTRDWEGVLEINSSVRLESVSGSSSAGWDASMDVFDEAVRLGNGASGVVSSS